MSFEGVGISPGNCSEDARWMGAVDSDKDSAWKKPRDSGKDGE